MKKNRTFKLMGLALAMTLAVGIAGCSGNDKPTQTGGGSSTETTDKESSVNRIALERKLDYVKTNYIDKAKEFEAEGFNKLKAAYDEALVVYEDQSVTQEKLDEYVEKLDNLAKGLVRVTAPSKTMHEIGRYMDNIKGNYTLTVVDHYSKEELKTTPETFEILADGKSVYDSSLNFGLTIYDGYVHEFSIENEEIKMGRIYIGDNLFPLKGLKENEFASRAVNVIGKSEPFTSNGLDIYGSFTPKSGTKKYVTDNTNYYDFFLGLTMNRYNYGGDIDKLFSEATIEFENDVFKAEILDNDGKVAFEFTLSNETKTEIKGLEEYKKANASYESNPIYNPSAKAKEIVDEMAKNESGMVIDVYSNNRGVAGQAPNYTITSRVNVGATSYWLSSLGYGILDQNGVSNKFTLKDNILKVTGPSQDPIDELDLARLVLQFYESAKDNNNSDEYFITLDSKVAEDLYLFFDLANISKWGSKNYFNDDHKDIKLEELTELSLSLNSDGNLTVTLWNENRMLVRGVIKEYKNVKVGILEDSLALAKSSLNELIAKASGIKNDNKTYSEASFKALTNALAIAREVVAKKNVTSSEITEAKNLLDSRFNELEKSTFIPSEKGYAEVTEFIDGKVYADLEGIGDLTFVGYNMEVIINGESKKYAINTNYYVDLSTNSGYIKYENAFTAFTILDGEFKLGDAFMHKNGFSTNNANYVFKKLGRVDSMSADEWESFKPATDMVRIPNSNEWFIQNTSYASFIMGANLDNAMGLGLELVDNTLVVKVYATPNIDGVSVPSKINDAIAYRGEVIATAIISNPGKASNKACDDFLKGTEQIVAKEMVATITSLLNENIKVYNQIDGTYRIYNDKFVYNSLDSSVYIEAKGKVKRVTLDMNALPPYTMLEPVVKVGDVDATTVEEVCGDLMALKTITPDKLTSFEVFSKPSRDKYTLDKSLADGVIKVFDPMTVEDYGDMATVVMSLNSSFDIILGYHIGHQYREYLKLSSRITDSDQEIIDMIGRIIIMENM